MESILKFKNQCSNLIDKVNNNRLENITKNDIKHAFTDFISRANDEIKTILECTKQLKQRNDDDSKESYWNQIMILESMFFYEICNKTVDKSRSIPFHMYINILGYENIISEYLEQESRLLKKS